MNDLLDKYWEGTLSLKEEDQLRDYFKSNHIAPEHEIYKDLFDTLDVESEAAIAMDFNAFEKVEDFSKPDKEKNPSMWKGLAIAAGFSLLIAVGASLFTPQQENLGTYEDPQEALAATMEALELVSEKFNNGRENLKPAAQVSKQTSKVFKVPQQ